MSMLGRPVVRTTLNSGLVTSSFQGIVGGKTAKMAGLREGVEHVLAIISSFSKLHVPPLCSVIARR